MAHSRRNDPILAPLAVSFAVLMAMLGSGCSSGSTTPTSVPFAADESPNLVAPTVPVTLIGDPQLDLDPAVRELVTTHSAWLCELQRRTFGDPADAEVALQDHLGRLGVDSTSYETFVGELATDQNLRDAVLFDYQQSCLRD